MTRWSIAQTPPRPGGWWVPFAAGLAAGLAGGILWARREPGSASRPSLGRAFEGARDTVEAMAGALLDRPDVDLEAIQDRMSALPGSEGLRLRMLTDGIVEVVGTAPDPDTAQTVLDALAAEPGVRVVVNRVWTPASATPDEN